MRFKTLRAKGAMDQLFSRHSNPPKECRRPYYPKKHPWTPPTAEELAMHRPKRAASTIAKISMTKLI